MKKTPRSKKPTPKAKKKPAVKAKPARTAQASKRAKPKAAAAKAPSKEPSLTAHRAPLTAGFFAPPAAAHPGEAILLPVDPHTAFATWVVRERQPPAGVRAIARLFEGKKLVAEAAVDLSSSGHYFRGLTAGARYRAELLLEDRAGRAEVAAVASEVRLPPAEPARNGHVEFVQLPWGGPLDAARRAPAPSGPALAFDRPGTSSWRR